MVGPEEVSSDLEPFPASLDDASTLGLHIAAAECRQAELIDALVDPDYCACIGRVVVSVMRRWQYDVILQEDIVELQELLRHAAPAHYTWCVVCGEWGYWQLER